MLSIILFLLISVVNTQNYYPQQQYPLNNYNSWSSQSIWNPGIQTNGGSIRGNLLSDDTAVLLYGSKITVSLTDTSLLDVAARPLSTFVLYGSYRFPIAYNLPYSIQQIQANGNSFQQYTIQARIEKDGQLLYINDQHIPVQLIPVPVNPINIVMKKYFTGIYPGINGGIYSTTPPVVSGIYICQLRPDAGHCHASIPQYYFNTLIRSCENFIYGGCGGNQNRFSSRVECERTCSTYRKRIMNNNAKQKWSG